MSCWSSNKTLRKDVVAKKNKMFRQADQQFEKVTDVEIVGSGSRIDITLKGYLMDNSGKGTDKSEGCEYSSANEEMSVDEENKWC